MSETSQDIYTRLEAVIEGWNVQIVQSHDALSQQVSAAREHLERLVQAPPREDGDGSSSDPQSEIIASLEDQIARLTRELEEAHSPEPPLVGASAPQSTRPAGSRETDRELEEVRQELAASEEIRRSLRAELESTRADLLAWQAQSSEEQEATPEDSNDERIEALEASLNTAQAALVTAEGQVAALEATRDELRDEAAKALDRITALEMQLKDTEQRAESNLEEMLATQERCTTAEAALAEAETALAISQSAQTPPDESPGESEELQALRASMETMEAEHAAARERIAELEDLLAHAREQGETSSRIVGDEVAIEAFDAQGHKKRMGEILLELGVLEEDQLKAVLKEQSADPQHRLGALVVQHGFTGEDIVAKILAAQLRLPYSDVRDLEIEERVLKLVSPHVTRLHRCIPLKEEDGTLTAAMVNPLDLIAIEDLELASRCRVSPVVSTPTQIDERLATLYEDVAES